jgi:RNA polymerase sigma-70 factor (ECF subfamily)
MKEAAPSPNNEELTRAIKLSDRAAFRQLSERYYDSLYRFLWRKTRNDEAAQDLVQELFMNLWKMRAHLDENLSIKAYLYRAANNLAINHLRKKVLKQAHFIDNLADAHPGHSNEERELQECLDEALQDLPEAQRTVFMLNRFEGLKYAEIAEILQVSIKTVESRMSKTLKHLRQKFGPLIRNS